VIREKKDLLRTKFNKDTKQFLQPLALILICAVFILLILIVGIMDMRRIDNTLISFMQNRGLDIIGNVQRVAQGSFTGLKQLLGSEHADETVSPFSDETSLPQEALIQSLITLGRQIDRSWDTKAFAAEEKKSLAENEGLSIAAVFDIKGQIAFQSRPVPKDILMKAAPVVLGEKEFSIDLFNRSGNERIGFIAMRRDAGQGAILMVLDDADFQFWGARIAIQRAIEQAGWGKGVEYISVMNGAGQLLGSAGDIDESWRESAVRESRSSREKGSVAHRKLTFHGKDILEISGPVMLDGKTAGIARIGLERDRMDQILRENRNNMLISMMAIILIGVLSIWFMFHNQNRHFKRIEEMDKRLQQSERLSALGKLAAGVAHEIRNPLNAISMASQRLQREYLPELSRDKGPDFKVLTGVIRDEIRRLNGIIEEFLNFSRTNRLELKEYPIEEILQKLVSLIEEEAAVKGITIRKQWNSNRTLVPMDIDKLQQALLNLIKNGMESMSKSGALTIGVTRSETERFVAVHISDTGAGLTQEEIERIFSPEYTTKEKGLGLGLPISYEIIRAHGGEIEVMSEVGIGSTFKITLPGVSREIS
jgi:signal transduction histidine kinase